MAPINRNIHINIFLISSQEYMLWVLIRRVSLAAQMYQGWQKAGNTHISQDGGKYMYRKYREFPGNTGK